MAQAEEGRNITTEQLLIIQRNNFSADLLPRFVSGNNFPEKTEVASEDNEEIELSLGLSLNGRFGVDPRAKNNFTLKRSSSIPDFLTTNTIRNDDVARPETPSSFAPLVRTCSLPIETEEVWRKRKELQTLKRMEAKRKRSEKQRNLKEGREKNPAFVEEKCKENKRSFSGSFQQEQYLKVMDGFSSMVIPSWNFCSKGSICHGLELNCDKPNGGLPPQPSSQGFSAGSSGISDSESQAYQATGAHKCAEIRSPASVKSMSEKEWRLPMASRTKSGELNEMAMKNKCYVNRTNSNGAKEVVRNVLEDMPSVSTTGDGPNGKRVEGFLYGYRKGEEVRILCVCHGTFLTPSEFVKHAGGGDVTNPLKHIVVSSSSFL